MQPTPHRFPPLTISLMATINPVCSNTIHSSSSSVTAFHGSRLVRTVPEKTTGSYGTSDRFERRSCNPMVAISTPSISIRPADASTMRYIVIISVDLPLPVLPHTPSFYPPAN